MSSSPMKAASSGRDLIGKSRCDLARVAAGRAALFLLAARGRREDKVAVVGRGGEGHDTKPLWTSPAAPGPSVQSALWWSRLIHFILNDNVPSREKRLLHILQQWIASRAVAIFVDVAERGSFAEAARRLKRSPAAVTRAVADLEDRLGVRLLNRTTRAVSLTEAGARFLVGARRLLARLRRDRARGGGRGGSATG